MWDTNSKLGKKKSELWDMTLELQDVNAECIYILQLWLFLRIEKKSCNYFLIIIF